MASWVFGLSVCSSSSPFQLRDEHKETYNILHWETCWFWRE